MIPPLIEIAGAVYIVIDWSADSIEGDLVRIRKLSDQEIERYRRLRRESDIELLMNFQCGS